jgi:hypothetical protein
MENDQLGTPSAGFAFVIVSEIESTTAGGLRAFTSFSIRVDFAHFDGRGSLPLRLESRHA